jgi:hypothetical protein
MAVQESMQILATLLQFAALKPIEGQKPVLDVGMTAVPRRGTLLLKIHELSRAGAPIGTDSAGRGGVAQETAV